MASVALDLGLTLLVCAVVAAGCYRGWRYGGARHRCLAVVALGLLSASIFGPAWVFGRVGYSHVLSPQHVRLTVWLSVVTTLGAVILSGWLWWRLRPRNRSR